MAVTVDQYVTANGPGSDTTYDVTLNGLVADDLVVRLCTRRLFASAVLLSDVSGPAALTWTAGATVYDNGEGSAEIHYTRITDAGNYVIRNRNQVGTVNQGSGCFFVVLKGVDTTTALHTTGAASTQTTASTSVTVPGFTTNASNGDAFAMCMYGTSVADAGALNSNSWTTLDTYNPNISGASDIGMSVAYKSLAQNTATSDATATQGGSRVYNYAKIAFKVGAGAVTGTAAVDLGGLSATASGVPDVAGTVTASLGGLTAAATGTPDVAGVAAVDLGGLTATATGTPDVAGVAAVDLGGASVTVTGVGTAPGGGAAVVTLGGLTVTVAGTRDVAGTAAVDLGGATVTVAGTPDVAGTAAVTLGGLTVAVAGTPDVAGTVTVNLGGVTVTATTTVQGTVTVNLGTIAVTIVGEGAGLSVEQDARRPDVTLEAKRSDTAHGPRRPTPTFTGRRHSKYTTS